MQEVIIGVIVLGSVIFLGRHIYKILTHKKKAGCAECGVGDSKTPVK